MEDFLKIEWSYKSLDNYESQISKPFVDNLDNSYAYARILNKEDEPETLLIKTVQVKEHVPGLSYFSNKTSSSSLNKVEQATCLKALELYQSGRVNLLPQEHIAMSTYQRLKVKINNENEKFLNFARTKWKSDHGFKMKANFKKCAVNLWKKDLKIVQNYSNWYREFETLPFTYDDSSEPTEMIQVQNLLEFGSVAKFLPPNLIMQTILTLPPASQIAEKPNVSSKLPVSMDTNVKKLLMNNENIDVVLSSGSLMRFINFMDDTETWDLPVKICSADNTNGQSKKIIYIDKTLPKKNVNASDLNYKVHKLLLKTNLCATKEFSFPNVEAPVDEEEIQNENKLTDEIDDIQEPSTSKTNIKNANRKNKIHHNVSYRLWNLHLKLDENNSRNLRSKYKQFNVLIRCKIDGCEKSDDGSFIPVCIYPKVENQLNYGANINTKSELAKQWVQLSSRPFSKLYRARIHRAASEIIAIENCTLQKINNEALHHHNYKPYHGLGLLYKTLTELQNYDAGSYLLRYSPKNGPFLLVLKECDKSYASAYSLHEDYENNSSFTLESNLNWCPIDPNYILPAHKHWKQLPGLFQPKIVKKMAFKKKGKKKKKGNQQKV